MQGAWRAAGPAAEPPKRAKPACPPPAAAGGLRPGRGPAGLAGLAGLAEGEREKDGGLRGLPGLRRGREPGAARPPQAGSTGEARGFRRRRMGLRPAPAPAERPRPRAPAPAERPIHGRLPPPNAPSPPNARAPAERSHPRPPAAAGRPLQNPAERGKINPYPPTHKGRTV